jgi:hypothetical protein
MTLTIEEPGAGFVQEEASVWSDAELLDHYVRLRREATRLEAQAAALLGEIDSRGSVEPAGFLSTTAWLIHATGEPPGPARSRVRMARGLRALPEIAAAFQTGGLDSSRVRLLLEAHRVDPELFRRDEQVLLGHACTLSARDFPRAVAYWKAAADDEACRREDDAAWQRRELLVSSSWGGLGYLNGRFDAESTEIITTALRALIDPAGRDPADTRSPAQRRADALVEICRLSLDRGTAPRSGGERPHLVVTVDLDVLAGRGGGRCELSVTGPILPEAARRIACDAGVCRIITRGASEILDVGRRTRVVSPALRRALELRDGGCTHPGCDRPPQWCDAHHIVHWADGGETCLANLRLLCRRHHRMEHERRPPRATRGSPAPP